MIAWRFRRPILVATAVLMASVGWAQTTPSSFIPGFSPTGISRQLEIEGEIPELLDPVSTERHFRYLTEEPHPAGSERNKVLAEYTRDRFLEYGLEDVQIIEYQVLLPFPESVEVEMVAPISYRPQLREAGYPVDKDSYSQEVGTPYLGMSASGEIVADVIYAHSGNPEDYDWLESQGIDPRGKIALVRYSMPYSYRGFKAWEAERRGVAALIIYSDPAEDGYHKGLVFPEGPWGPPSHIQRGAITYDFIVPGDPLTPGWASLAGVERIAVEEARSVPRIMAVPMSWQDAQPILESLGGPVAPYAWQGGLPITYHVGGGPARIRMRVAMDDATRPIQVVTGKIRGASEPDRVIIAGNHRDAWVYGGVDPSSGSASLIELARVLGALKACGHRPNRTIQLASWDAEEWHLTGSTEWGEQFSEDLSKNAVAYLNVDSSTSGSIFSVSAVASLNPLIDSVAHDVIDPDTRLSLERARARHRAVSDGADPDDAWIENELGSGSDYTVFLNRLGIPIVDMVFDGPYGVYHSQYDDYYWMSRIGDPGFRYMTTMVEVWARLALRLANAQILPYSVEDHAATIGDFIASLADIPDVAENLDLTSIEAAQAKFHGQSTLLDQDIRAALDSEKPPPSSAQLNELLLGLERVFLLEEGLPDRPWFRHSLYAPRFTYAAMSLPGVREAAERSDWQSAKAQLALLTDQLHRATDIILEARGLLP